MNGPHGSMEQEFIYLLLDYWWLWLLVLAAVALFAWVLVTYFDRD